MRIESLWAKGYRSLRDVRLDGLGAFNVFYGPNGAGKSNILEAIRVLLRLSQMLQEDDAVAVDFLQDVHGAAVRMVKVQSKKPRSG